MSADAEDRRRIRTPCFNAWKYADDDTVLAGLLGAFPQPNLVDQLGFRVGNYHRQGFRCARVQT
ncbi:MAG: hypothetical protein K9L70_01260 [Thiohalocapsa sp.]|nr:hypothetical protein [Thiohalocapsa sp.]MCF7989537.1 hypothetical protein [Thiohalocapsa sp.]